mmetsp:Transcript_39493/g.113972  ORF Transcript_39493/g.113972 Transcript_39493/m.113972 type:complete len:172 (+) Transcript_39493:59-574(+)
MGLVTRLGELPLVSKVLLGHGLLDVAFPNPTTAAPLIRIADLQIRSKKKRGWAWLFLMCGLMKVHSAFADPPFAARMAGWSYVAQATAVFAEGFVHRSIPRAEKVLVSNVCFCLSMWAWLQFLAWKHARRQALQAPISEAVRLPDLPEPSAPALEAAGHGDGSKATISTAD